MLSAWNHRTGRDQGKDRGGSQSKHGHRLGQETRRRYDIGRRTHEDLLGYVPRHTHRARPRDILLQSGLTSPVLEHIRPQLAHATFTAIARPHYSGVAGRLRYPHKRCAQFTKSVTSLANAKATTSASPQISNNAKRLKRVTRAVPYQPPEPYGSITSVPNMEDQHRKKERS